MVTQRGLSYLLEQSQRCGWALRDGLVELGVIQRGGVFVVDDDAAVVLNLEDVLGDRLADAVAGALVEVDFYVHGRIPITRHVLERA